MFKTQVVSQSKGRLLDKDGKHISDCLCTPAGILVNVHALTDIHEFEFSGKRFPKTARKIPKKQIHSDMAFLELFDGAPVLPSKYFTCPDSEGQRIIVCSSLGVAPGAIAKIDAQEIRTTACTEPGWCGSPYVDSNGKVVAIHYAAGEAGKDNIGMKITNDILELLRQPKDPKNF